METKNFVLDNFSITNYIFQIACDKVNQQSIQYILFNFAGTINEVILIVVSLLDMD